MLRAERREREGGGSRLAREGREGRNEGRSAGVEENTLGPLCLTIGNPQLSLLEWERATSARSNG